MQVTSLPSICHMGSLMKLDIPSQSKGMFAHIYLRFRREEDNWRLWVFVGQSRKFSIPGISCPFPCHSGK